MFGYKEAHRIHKNQPAKPGDVVHRRGKTFLVVSAGPEFVDSYPCPRSCCMDEFYEYVVWGVEIGSEPVSFRDDSFFEAVRLDGVKNQSPLWPAPDIDLIMAWPWSSFSSWRMRRTCLRFGHGR